eukprot:TRINITY_DN11104_c0_g2_i1.p1 TRINITY_DN11104_c0_g2~~TRINITY_DN11104_c0_g2_i1.p1  ORF type:complete len:155 (+),score=17.74 TRINITY_DN11104_c0_g2_i1:86-550(+)
MAGSPGRLTMKEQGPAPEFVPTPRFRCTSGHSSLGGSDENSSDYSNPVLTLQSIPGRREGSDDTINVFSSSTARVPPSSSSSRMLPRSFLAALHSQGRCLPCRYHKQAEGCKVGACCNYCLYPHEDWSLSRTQRNFRKHIGEYSAQHGLGASES